MTEDSSVKNRLHLTRRRLIQAGIASTGLVASAVPGGGGSGFARAEGGEEDEGSDSYIPRPDLPEYDFEIQHTTLDPDGRKPMPGVTVNGVLPGPEIRVKRGDLVRIRTSNRLEDQPASIHWPGLLLPAGMDGVPNVYNSATPGRGCPATSSRCGTPPPSSPGSPASRAPTTCAAASSTRCSQRWRS